MVKARIITPVDKKPLPGIESVLAMPQLNGRRYRQIFKTTTAISQSTFSLFTGSSAARQEYHGTVLIEVAAGVRSVVIVPLPVS